MIWGLNIRFQVEQWTHIRPLAAQHRPILDSYLEHSVTKKQDSLNTLKHWILSSCFMSKIDYFQKATSLLAAGTRLWFLSRIIKSNRENLNCYWIQHSNVTLRRSILWFLWFNNDPLWYSTCFLSALTADSVTARKSPTYTSRQETSHVWLT